MKDGLVINKAWKCRRLLNNMILNESTTLWLARVLESKSFESSESPLFYPAHYLFDTWVIESLESHAHVSHVTLPLGGTVIAIANARVKKTSGSKHWRKKGKISFSLHQCSLLPLVFFTLWFAIMIAIAIASLVWSSLKLASITFGGRCK